MRIVSREDFIERRVKVAGWIPLVAFGVLAFSLFMTFRYPQAMVAISILMLVGLVGSIASSYLVQNFAGPMAPHIRVPEALKGLDDEYTLLMYKTPVRFVLLEPGGLTAIRVKAQRGTVTYQNGKWRHQLRGRIFFQFGGEEALGKPDREAEYEAARLRKYLNKHIPEETDVPVRGIALFTNPEVQLEAEDMDNVIRAAKIKNWLRGPGKRTRMPKETRQILVEALGIED